MSAKRARAEFESRSTQEATPSSYSASVSSDAKRHRRQRKGEFSVRLAGWRPYDSKYFRYDPDVLEHGEALELMRHILNSHRFTQDYITVGFGDSAKRARIRRTQALLSSTAGVRYRYSGSDFTSQAWTERLQRVCDQLSAKYGVPLNSALVNHYRSGDDCVGRHADNEDDMAHDVIVTLSLGTARTLRVTHKDNPMDKRIQCALQNGSVFVQKRGMQKRLKHEIPPEKRVKRDRVSVTFRQLRVTPQPVLADAIAVVGATPARDVRKEVHVRDTRQMQRCVIRD